MSFTRRNLLAAAAAFAAFRPALSLGQSTAFVDAAEHGVMPGTDATEAMRAAVAAAAGAGRPLFLPPGAYAMRRVELPSGVIIEGARGATRIVAVGQAPVFAALRAHAVTLRDLVLDGAGTAPDDQGLLSFVGCEELLLERLELREGAAAAIRLRQCSGRIRDCAITGFSDGIFSLDGHGLVLAHNRIRACGNGGVRVWASEAGGRDGTMVLDNDIQDIRADGGGNGQNGNGINVYRASGVTVSGNRLARCAFSAVRLNSTTDTIVSTNTCLDSGEVAIFSEFAFSGSVIADNIVDGAAQGISITNFNENGRLATCTGNIVRNIAPLSRVNPDTRPVGIFAEADTVIADNVVDSVPGLGIGAGWGPYLRDVVVSGNVVRDTEIGIGVSVAEGAGQALVASNLVSGARRAGIAGLAWTEIVTNDLERDAGRFPNAMVEGNRVD